MTKHNEGGTNIQGNRFEADVSRNKQRADIKDRKIGRVLHTLNREDVQELHDMAAELLGMMEVE